MYKAVVIEYSPKADNMAEKIEEKANEMLQEGYELATMSVTPAAKAILVFYLKRLHGLFHIEDERRMLFVHVIILRIFGVHPFYHSCLDCSTGSNRNFSPVYKNHTARRKSRIYSIARSTGLLTR